VSDSDAFQPRDAEAGETSDFYQRIGGQAAFDTMVRLFYEGVQTDPVLWPMYPQHDLEGAIHRLSTFLQQYWGGPATYSQERGHPRLRMRHVAYKVNPDARDRWLGHMRAAMDQIPLSPLDEETLWNYLERAAHLLVNTFEE
jgi:hemoglobin